MKRNVKETLNNLEVGTFAKFKCSDNDTNIEVHRNSEGYTFYDDLLSIDSMLLVDQNVELSEVLLYLDYDGNYETEIEICQEN